MAHSKISFDDSLSIYLGEGCNSIVLTSKDKGEALIVDTKWFRSARRLRAAFKALRITIINTHRENTTARKVDKLQIVKSRIRGFYPPTARTLLALL